MGSGGRAVLERRASQWRIDPGLSKPLVARVVTVSEFYEVRRCGLHAAVLTENFKRCLLSQALIHRVNRELISDDSDSFCNSSVCSVCSNSWFLPGNIQKHETAGDCCRVNRQHLKVKKHGCLLSSVISDERVLDSVEMLRLQVVCQLVFYLLSTIWGNCGEFESFGAAKLAGDHPA